MPAHEQVVILADDLSNTGCVDQNFLTDRKSATITVRLWVVMCVRACVRVTHRRRAIVSVIFRPGRDLRALACPLVYAHMHACMHVCIHAQTRVRMKSYVEVTCTRTCK